MDRKQLREQVSARLDPELLEVVRHVAELERRPTSQLIRNIIADWAKSYSSQLGRSA
jgi:predicted transcriptional regulator